MLALLEGTTPDITYKLPKNREEFSETRLDQSDNKSLLTSNIVPML